MPMYISAIDSAAPQISPPEPEAVAAPEEPIEDDGGDDAAVELPVVPADLAALRESKGVSALIHR